MCTIISNCHIRTDRTGQGHSMYRLVSQALGLPGGFSDWWGHKVSINDNTVIVNVIVITSAMSQTWWGNRLVDGGDLFFSTELSRVPWWLWVSDDLSLAEVRGLSGTVRLTLPSFKYTLQLPDFGSRFRLKQKQVKLTWNLYLNRRSYKKIN